MGEIRFVGTGETRGYPYLVCKKCIYSTDGPVYMMGQLIKVRVYPNSDVDGSVWALLTLKVHYLLLWSRV